MERYQENGKFLEFLSSQFDKTAENATVEELAEFVFGSLYAAIEAFREKIKSEG